MSDRIEEIKNRIKKRAVTLATLLSVAAPTAALANNADSVSQTPKEQTVENVAETVLPDMSERDEIIRILDDGIKCTDNTKGFELFDKLYAGYVTEDYDKLEKKPRKPHEMFGQIDVQTGWWQATLNTGTLGSFDFINNKLKVYTGSNIKNSAAISNALAVRVKV